jgi:glycine/D-amino acid oxidase-like deaminating enzyme
MHQADVVIVGAGLAGLATAWHLGARRRVWVVDQGEAPGRESSSLGVGMVRRLVDDPVERALAHRTVSWLERPGPDFDELGAQRTGALIGALGEPSSLHDAVANLLARGVRVEEARPAAIPLLEGSPVRHVWHLPDEWQLDPPRLVAGFVRGLARMGVPMWTGAQVQELVVTGGALRAVRTDRGEIATEQVVLAAGAWSARLALALGLHRPLFPLRRSVVRLPSPALEPTPPWLWIDDVGLYARRAEAEWWISPCDETVSFPSPGPGSRREAEPAHLELALHKVQALLPALRAPLSGGWSGLRTFAPDRRPILGPDRELPGLWWAAGLGGYGVSTAWAAGEAVANWLCGEQTPWLRPELVSPNRAHLGRWPIRPDGEAAHAVLIGGRLPEGV